MDLPTQIYQDLQNSLPQLKEAIQNGTVYATELGHRIIQWDIVSNIFWIIILFATSILSGLAIKWCIKKHDVELEGITFFLSIIFIIAIVFIGIFIFTIIKDVFVPELRIIEILQNILT